MGSGTIEVLTANLACGGFASKAHADSVQEWLADPALQAYGLLFLQECPDLNALRDQHYTVVETSPPEAPTFKCRSAVVARPGTEMKLTPLALENAAYHGSYLAGAVVEGILDVPIAAVSVHASPTRLTDESFDKWAGPSPTPRAGGGPDAGRLFHADLVLATLRSLAASQPVLLCGDWNEARAWDDHNPGTWGKEFFELVVEAGLRDVLFERWGEERPTRGKYQIDHVFASPAVVDLVTAAELAPELRGASDHTPVRFSISM